jgi:adenosylhomocysteine nucleosidase
MKHSKIGFVTGLAAEAGLLRQTGFLVAVGGGTPEGALRAAEEVVAGGAQALVSFGLAGGLRPGLLPGTVLVPSAVFESAQTYTCDTWLMELLGGSTGRPILAGHRIAASAGDKALLYRRGRADAIDLESGAIARVAMARGMPFAVLRAVADPAERNLPPAALAGLKDDGAIDLPRILLSVLRHPWQISGLLEVGKDAARARRALVARVRQIK